MKFSKDSHDDITGYMGPGTEIQGELHFQDVVRIDGKFNGMVESKGTLIIGDTGHVVATVKIGRITISGRVEGSISASEKVEILHTGKVFGDISAPILIVEEGAVLEGKCSMLQSETLEPAKPTPTGVAAMEMKS